jgi:serine/threonine protein kinase
MAATGGAGAPIPMLMIGDNAPNYGPGGNITQNGLSTNQTLVEEVVGPYSLSFIKNRDGTRRMVRKITTSTNSRRGQFEATVREADVYNELIKNPDYKDHILPFIRSKRTNDWVYIDFEYVNGMDFERYLATLPDEAGEERKYLLLEAIRHLQWLLTVGYSHGDVKLNNFYIDTTTRKTYIIDFGTSRKLLSMGGIYADVFKLLNMTSILFPRLTDEAEHAILETAKAAAKSTTSTAERGIQMYISIAEQLASTKLVGGGRRRTQRHRKRRVRRTHRSIPRIIR